MHKTIFLDKCTYLKVYFNKKKPRTNRNNKEFSEMYCIYISCKFRFLHFEFRILLWLLLQLYLLYTQKTNLYIHIYKKQKQNNLTNIKNKTNQLQQQQIHCIC